MIWQKLLKNPILIIGIILMGLFLTDKNTTGLWYRFKYRYIPNTCQSIVDRSKDSFPDNWTTSCPGTELLKIQITSDKTASNYTKLRQIHYFMLANAYVTLANVTNQETLYLLKHVEIKIIHSQLEINSKTTGKDVTLFHKLTDKSLIAKYLKGTVKVGEKKLSN